MKIEVALDRSDYAETVLDHAVDQAVRDGAPDLHFITVVPRDTDLDDEKRWLAALVLPALEVADAAWTAHLHVRTGKPAAEIAALANDLDADLVVVGRFGLHHRRRSYASRIIDAVSCPVLAVQLRDAPEVSCPRCAEIRRTSNGARMFCDKHAGDRVSMRTADLTTTPTGGGPML